jgi:uncharacterized protein Usg
LTSLSGNAVNDGTGCGNYATTRQRISNSLVVRAARQRGKVTAMTAKTDGDFAAQLSGYSLTTAEIVYRLPDHPALLQTFIWQEYDVHPRFPRLKRFLDFWTRNLEGRLFRVTVAHKKLITPAEVRLITGDYQLH